MNTNMYLSTCCVQQQALWTPLSGWGLLPCVSHFHLERLRRVSSEIFLRAHPPHPARPGKRPRDPGLQGPRTETKTQWVGKIRAHSPTRWSYNNRTHIYIYGYGSSHSLSSSSPRERSKLNLYKESRCCCWLLFLGQTAGRQSEPLQP